MQMRTIDQAMNYLKLIDPSTAFTKTALRRFVLNGEVPSVRVGQKYLISLEAIESFLKNGTIQATDQTTSNGIRKLEVKR